MPAAALPAPRRKRCDALIASSRLPELPHGGRAAARHGMEEDVFHPVFAPAASAQMGWPGVNAREEPTGAWHCQGHGVDNQNGAGMLLASAGPAQAAETLAAAGSQGDGADLRANTSRAWCGENKGDVWVGGRRAQWVTRSPYLPGLFAPRLSQSLQDAKVQGKAAQDDRGTLPPSHHRIPGHLQ